MAADLSTLDPDFRETVELVLADCRATGFDLVPFFALRTPHEQARLWRQARATAEILARVDQLRGEGAMRLARVLEEVGPQHGRWATNALPGESWHQWGEAVDCFVLEAGKARWSSRHPGYAAYATAAEARGLTAGHFWTKRDAVHVQARRGGVRAVHDWPAIDAEMATRFSL